MATHSNVACLVAPPLTGLYFMLNGRAYLPGDSVVIADIGSQSYDRQNPGATLVCVTTNVNSACCRGRDNNNITNATAGAVGEWYYHNCTRVPRPGDNNVVDFARVGFSHHVRLARDVSGSTPPLGVYTCEVPEESTGFLHNASIIIHQKGNLELRNISGNLSL